LISARFIPPGCASALVADVARSTHIDISTNATAVGGPGLGCRRGFIIRIIPVTWAKYCRETAARSRDHVQYTRRESASRGRVDHPQRLPYHRGRRIHRWEPDLRLSKRTEYGLRAVVQLARLWPQGYVQSRDLAQHEKLPNKFLEAILLALRRGGFLESKVGSGGGYRLARAPREINVGDLLRRLEGRLTISHDTGGRRTEDNSPGEVAVRMINEKLTEATDNVLDNMTLEQLMEHVGRLSNLQQQMYYI
jgi:Rrf2 family protein